MGISVQKANRLYNKHLSEEIKSHLINISDDYGIMETWLISNYVGPSRIVGDIINNLSNRKKPGRRSLPFTQQSPEQYKDWKGYLGLLTSMKLSWNPVYYPEVFSAV